MKKIPLLLSSLFVITTSFSQTPFVGKITLQFTADRDKEKQTGTVEVFYGDQKVRGIKKIVDPKHDYDNDDLLIDFTKGIVYYINPIRKTYQPDTIQKRTAHAKFPMLTPSPEKNSRILNYQCSAFTMTEATWRDTLNNMDFIFWYADSLYFQVDKGQILPDDAALFTNGKNVGMGIKVYRQSGQKEIMGSLIPVSIEEMPVPDSLFEIPKDYVLETTDQYLQADTAVKMAADSVAMIMDSMIRVNNLPKKPVKKAVPKSTPKKAPVKGAAIRRKE